MTQKVRGREGEGRVEERGSLQNETHGTISEIHFTFLLERFQSRNNV